MDRFDTLEENRLGCIKGIICGLAIQFVVFACVACGVAIWLTFKA